MEGIHPFITGILSQQDRATQMRNINAYDAVVQGVGAWLDDLVQLQQHDKVPMPQTYLQAVDTFCSFQVLVTAMLGHRHQFTTSFGAFVQAITTSARDMECHFSTPLQCALLV